MKTFRLLLMISLVVVFTSTAMGATVTINGQPQISCSTSLTLQGMQVDSSGNVSLTVTCSGGACTPTSAYASPSSIVLGSITQGSTAPAQTVNIKDNCNSSLGYTASVTSGNSWISAPASGTGTMSVTFNTAGLAQGAYSGQIAVTPTGYSLLYVGVTLTVTAPTSGYQGSNLQYNTMYQNFIINPGQTLLYYATLPSDCSTGYKQLRFNLNQQQTAANVDMLVKKTNGDPSTPPTIADYNTQYAMFPYVSSPPTKTNDGIFFSAFNSNPSTELDVIGLASNYTTKYPNFGTQHDTYYILLVNPTSTQSAGALNFYCY